MMFRKDSLNEIVKNNTAFLTLIALNTLPCRSLLDRVRTLAVRTRHPIGPAVITQVLQIVLFVGQKDLVDALSADHAVADYELQS